VLHPSRVRSRPAPGARTITDDRRRPADRAGASSAPDAPTVAGPLVGEAVDVGAVTLDVHVDGPADGEVVLLVAGLGTQRIVWPPELLAAVHEAGFRTVAADNRDNGRSTVLPGEVTDLPRGADGWPLAPYRLADMAGDLVGLLDHLDVDRAHVVGVSMGGMIAQHLAFTHADRVATLTSVMSTTGARRVGHPHQRAKWVLSQVPPLHDRDAYLAHTLEVARATGTPAHLDEDRVRARAAACWVRGVHPHGTARQFLAIRGDGDRTARLRRVVAPTLVVHGTADPLIDVSGGRATADAIDGARLLLVDGLGHDLPVPFLPRVLGPVLTHLRQWS
jgi:pimeloyl-ACP methyl ester carboxylesterase